MTRKIYPLLSGGMDSTIATLKRIQQSDFVEVQPIFINYGQKAIEQEWNSVRKVSQKIAVLVDNSVADFRTPKRIDLSSTTDKTERIFAWSKSHLLIGNEGKNPYVENRNMVLLSIASSYVESQIRKSEDGIIVTGFRDEWPDTTGKFVSLLNALFAFLLQKEKKTITIQAPLIDYNLRDKAQMLEAFKNFRDIIDLTWSCYEPHGDEPCHKCRACTTRDEAFDQVFKY
jgi:7-cyano-7-deazaguanine synthase